MASAPPPEIADGILGLVFDLDGVLVSSRAAHAQAFEEVLAAYGIHDFQYDGFAGWRTADVFRAVFAEKSLRIAEDDLAACARRKSARAGELLAAQNPVAPDCVSVVTQLSREYRLALASSGSRAAVEAFLVRTGLGPSFRSVLCGDDVRRAKPDPEIFRRSMEALALEPRSCVAIEDAVAGIQAARSAGARAIGFGNARAADLRAAGAEQVVDSLAELARLLGSFAMAAPLTIDWDNWLQYAAPQVDCARWTAIIPAAGKGSRLAFGRPKVLFPVAGRPILEWLLDLLLPFCATVVFVLSPDGRSDVEPEIERLAPGRCRIVIQPEPTGMGDAVRLGAAEVATPHTCVIWGDQVALRRTSVEAVLRLHQGPLAPHLTVPTVLRSEPYIHFERDETGRIARLLQAREGDAMPRHGESDCGFFCFQTEVLRSLLSQIRQSPASRGGHTTEFNFLPIIPFAAGASCRVLTPRLMTLEETVGINSAADASRVAPFLRRSNA